MNYLFKCIIAALLLLRINCTQETRTESNEGGVTVEGFTFSDLWVRPVKSGMTSAAYFGIKNNSQSADSILGVESDISQDVQIHLSAMNEEGMMTMEPQGLVPVPAGSTVLFEQGGLHIMIIQSREDLVPDDSVSLYFTMSSGKVLRVKAPIKP